MTFVIILIEMCIHVDANLSVKLEPCRPDLPEDLMFYQHVDDAQFMLLAIIRVIVEQQTHP